MKERLTGAIILVALIVLLVPALLTGPIRSAPRVLAAASSASAEEPPLRSYTIHLADDARAHTAARASGPEQPAPIGAAAAAEPTAPAAAAPAVATPASVAPAPPSVHAAAAMATVTPPSASASSQSGAWMVQLGSFASRANAERLAQQLRARGFQMSVSQGSTGRRLYRVRAGPAASRAAAAQLAARLHAAGHAGAIVQK